MVNLMLVGKGNLSFFIGYIGTLLLQYFILPLIEILTNIGWVFQSIGTIAWLLFFGISIIGLLIIPNYFVYQAIITKEYSNNKLSHTTKGILFMLIGIIFLTMIGSWLFPAMANLFEYNWLANLFWVGLIVHTIMSIFVAPINKIISAK